MIRHEISTADLEPILDGSQTTDTLLHVIEGAGFLCYGPTMTALETCSPVAAGEKQIIPAGGTVSGAMSGGPMIVVTGQWGI